MLPRIWYDAVHGMIPIRRVRDIRTGVDGTCYQQPLTLTNRVFAAKMRGVSTPLRYALTSGMPDPAASSDMKLHRMAANRTRQKSHSAKDMNPANELQEQESFQQDERDDSFKAFFITNLLCFIKNVARPNFSPPTFSTAMLIKNATAPVETPTSSTNTHFKKMYCSCCVRVRDLQLSSR